jgi:putative ABC transport system permease protein
LKEGSQSATAGRERHWLRSSLAVTEMALALVLLMGAGLMVKSFSALRQTHHGFNHENLLTMYLTLPDAKYPESHHIISFQDRCLREFASIPGVRSAAASTALPFYSWAIRALDIDGRRPTPGETLLASFQAVSPDYFRTMQIPLRQGRVFLESDDAGAPRTAVVSESLARRSWPGQEPLGKRLKFLGPETESPWLTVVGVVADVKRHWVEKNTDALYCPLAQAPERTMCLVLRTEGDPLKAIPAVRSDLRKLDPSQPISRVKPMHQIVAESMAVLEINSRIMAAMGLLALVLAGVGIYGVMAYRVAQRTHEIGIRMALGARRRDVLGSVLVQGLKLALLGAGAGLPLAFGLRQLLAGRLFGVLGLDVGAVFGLAILLAVVALLASFLPARRATRVDPIVALRCE